jgi:hypothetical protein
VSVKHAASAPFARLDAAKPARRSPDLPIADLLRECHLIRPCNISLISSLLEISERKILRCRPLEASGS